MLCAGNSGPSGVIGSLAVPRFLPGLSPGRLGRAGGGRQRRSLRWIALRAPVGV